MLNESDRLRHLRPFDLELALTAIRDRETTHIRGLNACSSAIFLASLQKHLALPLIVVGVNNDVLDVLADNIRVFNEKVEVLTVQAVESSPYVGMAPNRRALASKVELAHRFCTQAAQISLLPMMTLARRYMPKAAFLAAKIDLSIGDEVELEALKARLLEMGYTPEMEVDAPGGFAVRGGVLDLFSPAYDKPLRLEFFGDELDEIRSFDPKTQVSIEKLTNAVILPLCDEILTPENLRHSVQNMRAMADKLQMPTKFVQKNLERLREGIHFWGISAITPSFYEKTESLFEYFPPNACVLWLEPELCVDALTKALALYHRQYQVSIEDNYLVSAPHEIFFDRDELLSQFMRHKTVFCGSSTGLGLELPESIWLDSLDNRDIIQWRNVHASERSEEMVRFLALALKEWERHYSKIAIVMHSRGALERIKSLFKTQQLAFEMGEAWDLDSVDEARATGYVLYHGNLTSGARMAGRRLAILTESEVFGGRIRRKRVQNAAESRSLNAFKELREGDYVVHEEHGIGQYVGLVTLETGGTIGDYLQLSYAGQDKLYIPVQRLRVLQRYAGAEQPQRLDRLGGGAWERTKEKVRKDVKKLAINLLELYAQRQGERGFQFSARDSYFEAFEEAFSFVETDDQLSAIDAVLEDMSQAKPMERLICGDVGFGKTEVAMRAAFRAVLDGKQVAVLVPTTILAEQHYESFMERFATTPVRIEALNRFRKAKQTKEILKGLEEGSVDIVIGTHRVLSKDVQFKSLGLLVIDEEHRFGVAHKEKMKALAQGVDCLLMTATPIPRTFQMCLGGLKDISVISTPPLDRLSIHTYVAKYSETLITQAIEHEMRRGGQVYFLHNRVQDLPRMLEMLQRCVPNARIGLAHGQMDEKSLEQSMYKFIHRQLDVLLCTTIIESGLDIPSANCLIVNKAERFGLAQLYQIRGRVGRSSTRAYCYLLTSDDAISDTARERLAAIEKLSELGAGLEIAYLDMELRGSGNLLGAEQSGNIAAVGLEMFAELLQEAVLELQGQSLPSKSEVEVTLPISAYIPEAFIPDIQLRLLFYKRLSGAESIDELYAIFGEMLDRFGSAPGEVYALKDVFELQIMLKRIGAKSMTVSYTSIGIELGTESCVDPKKLMDLVLLEPKKYSLRQDGTLLRYLQKSESDALVETVACYLDELYESVCVR
ncbi:MAG: transcription-repair coupling factor [Bradymonadales bacterium]|jgi:transcription-repair coupling factor (superfamily II helicase)